MINNNYQYAGDKILCYYCTVSNYENHSNKIPGWDFPKNNFKCTKIVMAIMDVKSD